MNEEYSRRENEEKENFSHLIFPKETECKWGKMFKETHKGEESKGNLLLPPPVLSLSSHGESFLSPRCKVHLI